MLPAKPTTCSKRKACRLTQTHLPPPGLGCLQVTSYEKALAALRMQVEQGTPSQQS